jgi:hypothetical protein
MHVMPLHRRPLYIGLIGGMFGIASVAGPLLGGVLTERVSWRWWYDHAYCILVLSNHITNISSSFYINLPICGLAMAVMLLVLHLPPIKNPLPYSQQFIKLDPLGNLFFMPGIICLLLALQWGGTTYPWSSWRVILCLALFGVLILAFLVVQIWRQETATVPPRILMQRSIYSAVAFMFCLGACMMVMIYYVRAQICLPLSSYLAFPDSYILQIPVWFQAIKGVSAERSGIMNLPMLLCVTIGAMFTGIVTRITGQYAIFTILSTIIMSLGVGLCTTWTTNSNHAYWIGYQVILGLGVGLGMQQPALAAQTVLKKNDVPTGTSLMFFAQTLGGAVFIAIAQNIFTNKLVEGVPDVAGIDPHMITRVGATQLRQLIPATYLPEVLSVYNHALTRAFMVALAAACASVVGSARLEWRSTKEEHDKMKEKARENGRPEEKGV